MKRYTVKEVVKMENKHAHLHNIERERLDEYYYMPLALLTSMGLAYISGGAESMQMIPLIIGAVTTLFGSSSLVYLFSAESRSDKLYDKINEIYDVMGDDFKKQVKEEYFKQQEERNKRSR